MVYIKVRLRDSATTVTKPLQQRRLFSLDPPSYQPATPRHPSDWPRSFFGELPIGNFVGSMELAALSLGAPVLPTGKSLDSDEFRAPGAKQRHRRRGINPDCPDYKLCTGPGFALGPPGRNEGVRRGRRRFFYLRITKVLEQHTDPSSHDIIDHLLPSASRHQPYK